MNLYGYTRIVTDAHIGQCEHCLNDYSLCNVHYFNDSIDTDGYYCYKCFHKHFDTTEEHKLKDMADQRVKDFLKDKPK